MAAYSSSDLVTWRDEGLLFDPSTPYWRATCGPGCFTPVVHFDPRRNRYVLWVNLAVVKGQTSYRVLTSTSPTGPFGDVKVPSIAVGEGGDYDILVDRDGTGWLAQTDVSTPAGPVYVYSSDLWRGITRQIAPGGPFPVRSSDGNQALAARFWAALRFRADGTIEPVRCTAISDVPLAAGHTAASPPATYQTGCAIGAGRVVRQELRALPRPISGVRVTLFRYDNPDAALAYEISTSGVASASTTRGELLPGSLASAPRSVLLPMSAEANSAVTVTLRSSTARGCYGVLLAHATEPGAGIYEGPVAGTATRTRAVRILASLQAAP